MNLAEIMDPSIKDNEGSLNPKAPLSSVSQHTKEKFGNLERSELANCFPCAQWSDNPLKPKWTVDLLLHSESPQDLSSRIGFVVMSTSDAGPETEIGFQSQTDGKTASAAAPFKLHSTHSILDRSIFQQLLVKGEMFTKLELTGNFFNNANLWPRPLTSSSAAELGQIILPNLKILIMKANMGIVVKGNDANSQAVYYQTHHDFCSSYKFRAVRNLWFLMHTLQCPNLELFEMHDLMDWDDKDIRSEGFFYCQQPLINFIQRHANSINTLKLVPCIALHFQEMDNSPQFESSERVPFIDDLLFKIKLEFESVAAKPRFQRDLLLTKALDKSLRPWRQLLQGQSGLKTLAWITDIMNPWPFMRKDFINLLHHNRQIQNLMMSLYGDIEFKELHGFNDSNNNEVTSSARVSDRKQSSVVEREPRPPSDSFIKDYQIDAAMIHGLQSLKVLSIGCYATDPQLKYFCFYNLHLLPQTLEYLQILGIRVMASEIEEIGHHLKQLKSLTIIQASKVLYNEKDEGNINVEGVTASALRLIIGLRSLEQLLVIGFPIEINESESKNNLQKRPAVGWFGNICGPMCFPEARDETPSPSTESLDTLQAVPNKTKKANLTIYSQELQQIFQELKDVAEILDIQHEDGKFSTLLRIGQNPSEAPFNIEL